MKQKQSQVVAVQRRYVLKSVALSGTVLAALPAKWQKPVVDSVLLPAHAQATVCPLLVVGNGSFSPGSVPGTCGISFELLSGDSAININILSITNSALVGTDAVTYSGGTAGSVGSSSGLSVNWVGQAVGAPFACATSAPVAVNEVTFDVTYNCDAGPEVQMMTLSLQAIAASL